MLKIMGAFIVIACCSAIGIKTAGTYSMRIRALRSMIGSLTLMRSEIAELHTPIPGIFKILKKEAPAPASAFYCECLNMLENGFSLREAWIKSVSNQLYIMNPDDGDTVTSLADCLGRYDAEEQNSVITRAVAKLDISLSQAESQRTAQSKVCCALGISAGLMLAIIFI